MATQQQRDAKLRELLLYVATKSEGDKSFGRTKLNKILFYCDFLAYKYLGESITGERYQKREFGPGLRRLMPIVQEMEGDGDCFWHDREHYGLKQSRLMASRDAKLGVFSPQEVDLINEVIQQLWTDNARSVSELSHRFIGWRAAELDEDIPYETVFVGDPAPLSQEEIEYAQEVIDEYLADTSDGHPPAEVRAGS